MDTAVTPASDNILIHAIFAPDGVCITIEEQPVWATPHQWFCHLSRHTVNCFRPLAGGRGLFSLTREKLEGLKTLQ